MTTAPRTLVASLGLALALVGTTAGNTACDGQCSLPTERIALVLPAAIEQACSNGSAGSAGLPGAVHREGKALVFSTASEDFTFPDLDVAIPDGTFVSVSFACETVLPTYDQGRVLVIENLPVFDGIANPTEGGTRVWLVVAAGGTVLLSDNLPFEYALEQVCEAGNTDDGYFDSEALILADGNKAVSVPPGETRDVTLTHGPHAGKYSVQNVNITFALHTAAGNDFPVAVNFRIHRAD